LQNCDFIKPLLTVYSLVITLR